MQEWKVRLVEKMEETGLREIALREVANANGINHIKRQDALDILKLFVKRNPTYRTALMISSPNAKGSIFTTGVVTELQYETEEEWRKEMGFTQGE